MLPVFETLVFATDLPIEILSSMFFAQLSLHDAHFNVKGKVECCSNL
jgi:hypothetical protein